MSFISQLDCNPFKERGCISYFLKDVYPASTGILSISFYLFRSVWNRQWGCVLQNVVFFMHCWGCRRGGLLNNGNPWALTPRSTDLVGLHGALGSAFDKFPSGCDTQLPWEAPRQGVWARAGRMEQMASPDPRLAPFSTDWLLHDQTTFSLVATHPTSASMADGSGGGAERTPEHLSQLCSSPLLWSLCVHLTTHPSPTYALPLSPSTGVFLFVPALIESLSRWVSEFKLPGITVRLYSAIEPIEQPYPKGDKGGPQG